ncbi:MAG: hypothetical protein N2Z62_01805 [Rhodobacteraceae bacterium]|nr:hypothetical protein [Paracoccaceae bacterium]
MRPLILALALACLGLPAAARDCAGLRPRLLLIERLDQLETYLRCLEAELADLRDREARLRAALAAQAEALAAIPADYANIDGKVSMAEGRPIGAARFVLSARRSGAAASLALDRGVIEALCARPGGCAITLAHQALGFGFADPRVTAAVGPCVFDYDPAGGGWFRGAACGGEAARGRDGDGGATGPGGGGGAVIATAGAVCLLADADADPRGAPDALARDTGRGLYLIAAPARDPAAAPRFRCELTLR